MLQLGHMSYSSVIKRITFPEDRGAAPPEIEKGPRTYNHACRKSTSKLFNIADTRNFVELLSFVEVVEYPLGNLLFEFILLAIF